MNSALLIAIGMVSLPPIFFKAERFLPYLLLAPFYSLPLLVILKRQDIGTFSIGFQVLALISSFGFVMKMKSKFSLVTPGIVAFSLLTIICMYGLVIPQSHPTPSIVKLIACKTILIPVFIATLLAKDIDDKILSRFVKISFYTCIVSCVAGLLELQLGVNKLISLGLPYGAHGQIREFQTGRVRAIGLSLTNFEFSLFSGLVAIIAYAVLSDLFLNGKISKTLTIIALFSSVVNMYTSITRQGVLFPIIVISVMELVRKKNAVRIFSQLYFSLIAATLLLVLNNLFLNNSSFSDRTVLWNKLLHENAKFIGNGIGFCGGATSSSFAKNISQIFVDNYYISIFLQAGILGLIFYITAVISYLFYSNIFGKAIIFAILITSIVTEFWEYSSVVTIALLLISSVGNPKSRLNQK